jgi:hypothetical protein
MVGGPAPEIGEIVPQASRAAPSQAQYLAVVRAAIDVASARGLTIIATLNACAIWDYAVYEPTTPRTIAAAVASGIVLLPLIWLNWSRG